MVRLWKRPPRLRRDWERRLSAWAERAWTSPHAFGRHDCVLAPLGAVEAQTGRDLARGHRRRYRSRTEAARYLKGLGFRSIEALLDVWLPEVPVAFARRGDVVMAEGVPGICLGAEAMMITEDGNFLVPRALWSKAWRAGRSGAER